MLLWPEMGHILQKVSQRTVPLFGLPLVSISSAREKDVLGQAGKGNYHIYMGTLKEGKASPIQHQQTTWGIFHTLSRYIKLLTTVVGKKSVYMSEVVVIRTTLRTRMDLYVDIEQKRIIHLLWAIFLVSRDLFSKEVQQGEALP